MTAYVQFANGETYKNDRGLWADALARGDAKALSKKAGEKALADYTRQWLLKWIKPKTTLKVICTSYKAYPGSSAYIVLLPALDADGNAFIMDITSRVCDLVTGMRMNKDGAILMGGCGYSKSFQIVYNVGCALWPHGTPEPHGKRNGEPDSNGGYALGHN